MNSIRDANTQDVFLSKEIGVAAFDPMAFLNQSTVTPTKFPSQFNRVFNEEKASYEERVVNSLLDGYLKHKRLAEEYEKVIAETDSRVSDLIIGLVVAFLIVIVLTAFLFSKFF